MTKRLIRMIVLVCVGVAAPYARGGAPEGVEFFEKKIRPLLVQQCYRCHSAQAKKVKGGLLLDSREALLRGGDSGPAIVPGQPAKSRLIEAVNYKNVELQMPPKGKLPSSVIADLTVWVRMKAPWPGESSGGKAPAAKTGFHLEQRKRAHWAWQPLRTHEPPRVRDGTWPLSAADRFILAALESKGLTPAAPADRRTLLRRLSFDLVGLPPTPAEVEAFVTDRSPQALAKVVDRLLASPRFGERWARHWMDLVRYAESRGHEEDYVTPNAYQYRDYLIRAFNADVPYDRLVTEHIAGDLVARPRLHPRDGFDESILGTGFWFLGEAVHSPVDIRQDEADRFDNQIDVMTKTFLGLTVSCARCHDHKFDAISSKDYYALYGFLESSNYRLARFDAEQHNRLIAGFLERLRRQHRAALQKALAQSLRPVAERLADYLLAAREVLRGGREGQHLDAIARAHQLEPTLLQRWVAFLKKAALDGDDPLHAWAKAATEAGMGEDGRLAQWLRSLSVTQRKRVTGVRSALKGAEVVLDYAHCASAAWMPDGVAFGSGPVRAGDLCFGVDERRPIVKFFDYGAAEKDPVWNALSVAAGSENDPGALGRTMRAGRTLRTPTFTITAGKVFYLVKGSGLAFASIGAHVMIAGPLHGQLVCPIGAGPEFRWVEHDLSSYKSQRAHIEFTASADRDFAVAMIVQAAASPGPMEQPNQLVLQRLSDRTSASLRGLALSYQELFTELTQHLAEDRLAGDPEAADYARLANWVLRQPQLFGLDGAAARKRLADAAGPFLAAQAKLRGQIRKESRLALAMHDGSGVDERVFIRGSPKALGEQAPRRLLEALAGPAPLAIARGSGRLELARQLTDPAVNPLLARVMVNRIWHHLFGRGIVASVDNFGVLGDRPSHPELLDYLAGQFVRQGWSIKKMIRSLVLSRTYQMSSRPVERSENVDPANLLLHRMPMRRLEGESIRDTMLRLSGRLNERMFGPSIPVHLTPFLQGRGRPASGPLDGDGRRSLYLAVRRNFLAPLLMAFDTPIPFSTVGRRTVSNVPAQALILMNDPFVHAQARQWARRVLAQPGTAQDRVKRMYESALCRPPSKFELDACLHFLKQQAEASRAQPDALAVWTDLAHALFNVKEFIFLR